MSESFEATESEYGDASDRSCLGTGLAQITSRLLRQLANGEERTRHGRIANTHSAQRDSRGNLVPWDDSPFVAWQRVVAVCASGNVMALVSLPGQIGKL
jgi:hypothetical protein